MKKAILLTFILSAGVFISGCSLGSSQSSSVPGSVWKSSDGGKKWELKNKLSEKASLPEADVLSLAINPQNSDNILLGMKTNGIFKTLDGGESWEAINFQSEKVYGLVMDPNDPQRIYASGVWEKRGKLFKSNDQGTNWEEIYTSPANGPLIIALSLSNKNPDTLYFSTSDKEVLKTVDGGKSWKSLFSAPNPVVKITLDASDENLVYFNTQNGEIFRSRDGGNSSEDISKKLSTALSAGSGYNFNFANGTRIIETDPQNSGWVYAGGKIGLMLSKDGGDSWQKIKVLSNPENFAVSSVAINPRNSQEIIYGSAQASFKTKDGGKTWSTSQFNTARTVNLIKYDTQNPENIWVGLSRPVF